MAEDRLTRNIEQIVDENGLKSVIGALARFCHSPPHQYYPDQVMATTFRRLNKIFEYLEEKSQ